MIFGPRNLAKYLVVTTFSAMLWDIDLIFGIWVHNDELFNICYGIFYELWNFGDFDRLCKLEKRGMSQSQPNFAEIILGWSSSKIVSGISEHLPRWPPQPNLIYHRTLWEIPIKIFLCSFGHLKKFLFLVMTAILDTGRRWRKQFWKGTT
jgi:hypothetical protein